MATVTVDRMIDAVPQRVFDAWTSPHHLRGWWWPEEYDAEYELDDAPGGVYTYRSEEAELELRGEFLAFEEPGKLSFTRIRDGDSWVTNVAVEFRSHRDRTHVIITHEGFMDSAAADEEAQAWSEALDRLGYFFKLSNSAGGQA